MKVFTRKSVMKIKDAVDKYGLKMYGHDSKILSYLTIHDPKEIITLYKKFDCDGEVERPIRISWASIGSVEEKNYNLFFNNLDKIIEIAKFIKKNIKIEEYDPEQEKSA